MPGVEVVVVGEDGRVGIAKQQDATAAKVLKYRMRFFLHLRLRVCECGDCKWLDT